MASKYRGKYVSVSVRLGIKGKIDSPSCQSWGLQDLQVVNQRGRSLLCVSSLMPTLSCSVSLRVRTGCPWELKILVLCSVGSSGGAVPLQRLCCAVEKDVGMHLPGFAEEESPGGGGVDLLAWRDPP